MDRDLIEAAQNGDRAAYVDLIRARQDRLFATAQRILRDIDRAEDALQDALVIAWRDLRGLRDPDRFDAWLQRLLINVCIAQATRERRRTANLRVLPVDGPAGPDELLSVADRDLLERGFRRLPPEQRAILVSTTTSATRRRRSPRRSASLPARPARGSITHIAPCGPPSRRTLGPRSGKVDRHDPAHATSNVFSTSGSATARIRHPIASSTSSPTASNANPSDPPGASTGGHSLMNAYAQDRGRRGGRPDRGRRRLQPAPGCVDRRRRAGRDAEPVRDADCHAFAHARADGNPGGRRDASSHSGRRDHAAGHLRHSPVAGAG